MKYQYQANFNINKLIIFITFCLFNIFISQSMSSMVTKSPKEYYTEAEKQFDSGSYENSIIYANRAKNLLGRTNPKIESLLMRAYYNSGDMVNAKIAYETLLKVTPTQKQNSELFKNYKEIGLLIDYALNEQEREYQQDIVDRQKEAKDIAINNNKKQRQKDIDKQDVLKTKNKNLEKKLFSAAKQSSDLSALQAYKDNFPSSNFSQQTQELIDILNVKDDSTQVENRKASFIGGSINFGKWISHYRVYPIKAAQMGIEGTVYASFTVLKNGDISDIEISKGHVYFNEEVIRLLNICPNWLPAKKNGEFIEERKEMGFDFTLQE